MCASLRYPPSLPRRLSHTDTFSHIFPLDSRFIPAKKHGKLSAAATARKKRSEQKNVVNTVKREFGNQNGNQTGKDDRASGKDSSLVHWKCVLSTCINKQYLRM